jgi:amidohydrolase
MPYNYLQPAKQLQNEIVDLRRHLHSHPELSFQEHETAKLVAKKLSELNYKIKTGVGKTGVTGDFGSGKAIAIRADMDGLPINELNNVQYRSKNNGVMHACGHDAHVSCALAAAKMLSGNAQKGKIRMVFQPAEESADEEGKSGARRMLEDDALNGVSAIIGLHVDASIPAGKIGLISGPTMAAVDLFRVKVFGKGGHGAYPETTVDAVVLGSHVIQAIQQVVSRRISALDAGIVTVGSFQSSSVRGNVISDHVDLEGTIRSFNLDIRKKLMEEVERACSVAKALGGDYQLNWEFGYPTTVNNPDVTAIMRQTAVDLIGEENVLEIRPRTWSEDFSMFAEVVPGSFMFLGVEIDGDRRSHHSPTFDINESGLYVGSAVLAETAQRLAIELN